MATLAQLVQRTVIRLSMVPGVSVQVYAEDRIAEMIWHKYLMVRDRLWWDDLMTYVTLTQRADGRPDENVVRQLPTAPVGDEVVINKYNDIQHAWVVNRRDPLKQLPMRSNPGGVLKQGHTLYRMADAQKVVRFAPFEAGQQVLLRYKMYYPYFNPDDEVPMDDQLMILGAAYDYIEDDGTNPGQAEKFLNMFNARLLQLEGIENDKEIPLSPLPYTDSSGYQEV